MGIILVDVHLNWLNKDVPMVTVSFLAQLGSGFRRL